MREINLTDLTLLKIYNNFGNLFCICQKLSWKAYHSSNVSTNSISLEGVQHSTGGFVNIGQINLDRCMIFSMNDPVTCRTVI